MTRRPGGWAGDRAWWVAAALVVAFLTAHLPFLASTLEDVDSINFALGVRDFDPGKHQPHPPGYPIFIALGKTARTVLSEPHALAVWAALFGALALLPLLRLFQALDTMDEAPGAGPGGPSWLAPPVLAVLVTATAPLYWVTAVRPMTDSVGLAFVLAAQALLATAYVRQSRDVPDSRGQYDPAMAARSARLILFGAFAAALAVGVRSQALWLTAPLLVLVLAARVGRGAAGALIGSIVWFTAGTLVWLVPLVMASGGPVAYMAALSSQAGEDWSWVELLVTRPSLRAAAFALLQTFVVHWAGLAWVVLPAAAAGVVMAVHRQRRALLVLAAAFGPYAVFHLLFQEVITTRYAMPLLVPVVYFAARGVRLLGRVPAAVLSAACAATALVITVPVTVTYAQHGSPVWQAMADVRAEAQASGPATLVRRHTFARALRAGLDEPRVSVFAPFERADSEQLPADIVNSPGALEDWRSWRDLPRLVTAAHPGRLWVFDSPRHLGVSLVDPSGLTVRRAYRWGFDSHVFLGGVRPNELDWIDVVHPSWVVGEGWYLTPDTAGKSEAVHKGLGFGPIDALVRARSGAAVAVIGGRHLGTTADPPVAFTVRLAGRELVSWTATAAEPFFLRVVDLPAGTLAGTESAWVPLAIEARNTVTGASSGLGAIDQFDLQDAGRVMMGFDAGWNEQEMNPGAGLLWRWTTARSVLRILAPAGVTLQMRGEAPRTYFPRGSHVIVKAGGRMLFDQVVERDFDWAIPVPAEALRESAGLVTVTTDQTFKPADRGQNADRRDLGLRIFSVKVVPAS
jgi:hypothetical protein